MGACAGPEPKTDAPGLRVGDVLGSGRSDAQFARADSPRAFEFPADHGAHPDFRSEWWYLTLALEDREGREFGVQFTVFRQAVFPGAPRNDPWRNGQAYLAHFAVTDVEAGVHREAERLSRGHPALAGARAVASSAATPANGTPTIGGAGTAIERGTHHGSLQATPTEDARVTPTTIGTSTAIERDTHPGSLNGTPDGISSEISAELPGIADMKDIHGGGPAGHEGGFAVWLEDWRLAANGDDWRLDAATRDYSVSIHLTPAKPIVLQGDRGLSVKGLGQASYYYSVPRLRASGSLVIEENTYSVTGAGWLDREWSTSVLGAHQVGWDWFALMLDNGEDIMAFRLRRDDSMRDPHDHGLLIDASGQARRLGMRDFSLEPLEYWRDERGTQWPVGWALTVGERRWRIAAALRDQRMDTLLTYWEGLVHVLDEEGVQSGRGYMELTGYR